CTQMARPGFRRRGKLRAVVAKNHDGEDLVGIRLVEVDEGWLPVAVFRVMATGDRAANRCGLSDVRKRLRRRQPFSLRRTRAEHGNHQETCKARSPTHRPPFCSRCYAACTRDESAAPATCGHAAALVHLRNFSVEARPCTI